MWEKREKDGLVWYTLPRWEEAGARLVMTTRRGGVSKPPYDTLNLGLHTADDGAAVIANREKLLAAVGGGRAHFLCAKQVHGRDLREVSLADGERGFSDYGTAFDDTDGLYTADKGVWLATFYADCLPVAVFHPGKKILGIAHSGWKGTFQNIGGALVAAVAAGDDPAVLWCAIGAAIGPCCYEVDEAFYRRFASVYPAADRWFRREGDAKPRFDNGKAVGDLLVAAGVRRENIARLQLCTACRDDIFFSHRRDRGVTGRHGLWGALI